MGSPPGTTVDEAVRILDEIVTKFEGLRTTFHPGPDGVRQVVQPMREQGYRCVTYDGEPEAEATEWLTEPFDLTREWPVRAAVWSLPGGGCGVRMAVHRVILDHEGMMVLRFHLHRAFRTGTIEPASPEAEPAAWSPVDIAEFEASPAGRRRDERAYAYWRRTLMTAPSTLFPTARAERSTDTRCTVYLARADLRPVVRDLASAFQVTEPVILTAAALLALSWIGGWPTVCATIISNNRSHREMRTSLSPMLDRSLISVTADPAQAFSAWAGSVGSAAIGAYQHSHADPNTLLRSFADVSMERGILLDRLPIINMMNDRFDAAVRAGRIDPEKRMASFPTPPDTYEAKTRPGPLDGMYLRMWLTWRRVSVELIAGEQVYDLPTGERLVGYIPAIVEALSAHGDLALGKLAEVVAAAPAGTVEAAAPTVHIDHTRVDLALMSTMLRECPGVTDCAMFVRTDADGVDRLHAHLAGDARIDDLAALRRVVLGRLPAHRHVLCPHWFRVVRTAPDERDSYAAWTALPPVVEGSGWPAPPRLPVRPDEEALVAALVATHPHLDAGAVDLGLPYCLVGGRFERVPEFLTGLAGRGIEGISVDDLMGTQPLGNLLDRQRQP